MSVGAGPARRVGPAPQRLLGAVTAAPERAPERRQSGALRVALAVAGVVAVAAAALTWAQVVARLRAPDPVAVHGTPEAVVWSGRVFRSESELAVWLRKRGFAYDEWVRNHPAAVAILREREPSLAEATRRRRAASAVEPAK
jgi:hypothetical protein